MHRLANSLINVYSKLIHLFFVTGMRFAKMQTKLGLYAILRKFQILESPKTEYPPVWDNKHPVLLNSKHEIYVQFKAI